MKSRICVRSMGLGAVIMLIGLAVGAIVSPPLIAHGGAGVIGVFGEIVCTGLTVIDKNGNKAIALKTESMGNLVTVYTQDGEAAIGLDSNYTGNFVRVFDPDKVVQDRSGGTGRGVVCWRSHTEVDRSLLHKG